MDLIETSENNYYTTCHTLIKDTGKGPSEDCITEIFNIKLTFVQKKRDCAIQLELSSCFELVDNKHRQKGKGTPV